MFKQLNRALRPAPRDGGQAFPSGSVVAREGRHRLLAVASVAALAMLTTCQEPPHQVPPRGPTPATSARSGVKGVVVLAPTCPVEGPKRGCGSRPSEATVWIRDRAAGSLAATVRSGRDGRFRAALPPSAYVLTAEAPGAEVCKPVAVTVRPGQYPDVTIRCDTGIR